jgi:hypothetical protein
VTSGWNGEEKGKIFKAQRDYILTYRPRFILEITSRSDFEMFRPIGGPKDYV